MIATGFLILSFIFALIGLFSEYLWFFKFDPYEEYEAFLLAIFYVLVAIYFRMTEIGKKNETI